jgi:hypothetical protein
MEEKEKTIVVDIQVRGTYEELKDIIKEVMDTPEVVTIYKEKEKEAKP